VTAEDVRDFLFELPDGRVIDMHLHATKAEPFEVALARRQIVADIFRSAFACDVAVITLGYIEAWWDAETQLFINITPSGPMARKAERFYFGRLDYSSCYDYVRRTVELLNSRGGKKKILITTSPIPLVRTFTADDVVVANTYSKATLRTVAGKIAEDLDGIDYFPSFESVTLTKQPYVWRDDLIHVHESFVNQIMTRVKLSYLEEEQAAAAANELIAAEIISLAQRKEFAQGLEKYRQYEGDVFLSDNPKFRVACAAVAGAAGLKEEAIRHARFIDSGQFAHPAEVFTAAGVLRQNGLPAEADALEKECLESIRFDTERALLVVRQLVLAERFADAASVVDQYVDPSKVLELTARFLADIYRLAQRPEAALAFLARVVKHNPGNAIMVVEAAKLMRKQGRWEDMLAILDPLLAVDKPYSAFILKQLALRRLERLDEAIACVEEAISLFPEQQRFCALLEECKNAKARRQGRAGNPLRTPPLSGE
jgi:tetratricopeptide (TPR) repeat protein